MALPDGHPALDLRHYDRSQLIFQIHEVFERETYLQAGISVGPGDVVVDAGANVGVAAVMFALRGAAAVHSFEPVLPLYELLSENVAGYEACTAHNLGLSSREGEGDDRLLSDRRGDVGLLHRPRARPATVSEAMTHPGVSEPETRSYAESPSRISLGLSATHSRGGTGSDEVGSTHRLASSSRYATARRHRPDD